MKMFFIYLIVFNGLNVFAQTPNLMDFFPSAVGNVWEYSGQWGSREEIYKDSIDTEGFRHLFYRHYNYYPPYATYKIDSTNNLVYYTPYHLNWLYYKLDADTGAHWMVQPETFEVQRIEALVIAKYPFSYFGKQTTFIEIMYFELQRGDTVINENAWPRFREVLAEGIGEIMCIDEEGGGPYKLLEGCIINGDTLGTITSVSKNFVSVNSFELLQNYPNPFNPITNIKFTLKKSENVSISVYNILGKEIKILINEILPTGEHIIQWDGKDDKANTLAGGVYFIQMQAGEYQQIIKAVLLK